MTHRLIDLAGVDPDDPQRTEMAGLLGTIGGLLNGQRDVLDMRPVVSEHGHEIVALDVVMAHGAYRLALTVAP